MTSDEKILKDILWGMYQENVTQGRHHETQRATVSGAIIAFVGLLISGISMDKSLDNNDLPFTIFLILLGCFGALFSLKQYERYLLHTKRAKLYRDKLDELMTDNLIYELKRKADDIHNKEFPRLSKMKLHYMWIGINISVTLIGVVLTFIVAKA